MIPHKLPGPNNTLGHARPAHDAAMKTSRPALHALCRRTFNRHSLDAIVLPTVPTFMAVIQNTDPGSNAGVPGLQIPLALGA